MIAEWAGMLTKPNFVEASISALLEKRAHNVAHVRCDVPK